MARITHYVKGNRGNATPVVFFAVDVQTKVEQSEVQKSLSREVFERVYWKRYRLDNREVTYDEVCRSDTAESFWAAIQQGATKGRCIWVIGDHIGRSLTLLGLWDMVESGRFILGSARLPEGNELELKNRKPFTGSIVLGDPPTIVHGRIRGSPGTVKFVDRRNYDTSPIDKSETAANRCQRSADTFLRLIDLVKHHNLGNLATTIAAQGWNGWRHRFLKHKVLVHDNTEAVRLERQSYAGGRVSVNFLGSVCTFAGGFGRTASGVQSGKLLTVDGPIVQCDVNALYPFICIGAKLPARLSGYGHLVRCGKLRELLDKCCVIAAVRINSHDEEYPVKVNGDLVFARGQFDTCLAGPELGRAVDHGHVEHCYCASWYHAEPFLSDWCQWVCGMREACLLGGDRDSARMLKAMAVGMLGKLGQREFEWQTASEVPAQMPFGNWVQMDQGIDKPTAYRSIGWLTQRHNDRYPAREDYFQWLTGKGNWPQYQRGEGKDSIVAAASYVTSLAREYLRDLLVAVGERGWYYCDTDSLFVNADGLRRIQLAGLLDPFAAGKLKVVGRYEAVDFRGLKRYVVDGKHVCAGLPGQSIELQNGHFSTEVKERFQSMVGRSGADGVKIRRMTFRPERGFRHGNVSESGWVEPIHLRE